MQCCAPLCAAVDMHSISTLIMTSVGSMHHCSQALPTSSLWKYLGKGGIVTRTVFLLSCSHKNMRTYKGSTVYPLRMMTHNFFSIFWLMVPFVLSRWCT